MNEYRFNVSLNGKHLFRTDWYNDGCVADVIQAELARAFRAADGYKISRYSRSLSMQSKDIAN